MTMQYVVLYPHPCEIRQYLVRKQQVLIEITLVNRGCGTGFDMDYPHVGLTERCGAYIRFV